METLGFNDDKAKEVAEFVSLNAFLIFNISFFSVSA
jgi:hypothetical protein